MQADPQFEDEVPDARAADVVRDEVAKTDGA